jgi:hypothetical protein
MVCMSTLATSSTPPTPQIANTDRGALETVRTLADGLARMLRTARALVGQRRLIDLAGLEADIGVLCARALDLPPEQGRLMRLELLALLSELDLLSEAVAARAGPHARR